MRKLFLNVKKYRIIINEIKDLLVNKSFISFLPIIFIILGILLRINLYFLNNSFWLDTCSLALNLERDYFELFKPLDNVQMCPPLFLIISKFLLNLLNYPYNLELRDLMLRVLPCFCSIITLPLFFLVTEKMYHNKYFNCITSFLLAFNPIAINYTIEFKQYSCELMYTLILFLVFFSINIKEANRKALIISALIISLAPWFSISSLFIIAGYFIYLLIKILRDKTIINSCLLIFLSSIFISVLISSLFYMHLYFSIYDSMHYYWKDMNPSFFLYNNFFTILSNKLNNIFNLNISFKIYILIIINMIILLFGKNLKNICIILCPIILTILACFFELYPFSERLILFLLPSFIIIISQFILILKEKTIITFFLAIVLIFLSVINITKTSSAYVFNKYDNRELFQLLKLNNPKLENVISDNVIYPYYSSKKAMIEELTYLGFENSKIPEYIKEIENTELWIYIPFDTDNYNESLKEYLYNNDRVKIINMYKSQTEHSTFLVHIKVKKFL